MFEVFLITAKEIRKHYITIFKGSNKKHSIMKIKRFFKTGTREEYLDILVLFLRIALAAFMMTHGLPKLNKLLAGGEIQFANPFGLGPTFTLILVVFAEFFCSILIGIGLGTRLASIPLIITMFVAAFVSHGADPFRQKEMALLYLLFYVTLLIVGSRKYSVDYVLTRKR
jgi:putative oxidoreductase